MSKDFLPELPHESSRHRLSDFKAAMGGLALSVTFLTAIGVQAQTVIFQSYRLSAEQFIQSRDFDKAEKILKAAVAEAENEAKKKPAGSDNRKNLVDSLELLAKIYRESGSYDKLNQINGKLQNLGVSSDSVVDDASEIPPSREVAAPVPGDSYAQKGEESPMNSGTREPGSESAKVTESGIGDRRPQVTQRIDQETLSSISDPRDVEFTESYTERVKPLKDDVIASTSGIAGELRVSSFLKKAREAGELKGHISWIKCVEFSPDGSKAASGGVDKTVRVWDLSTSKELYRFEGHQDNVTCVAFSPSGNRLISGSSDKTLKLWDLDSGRLVKTYSGHTNIVTTVAFSSTGRLIASGSYDGSIRVWDLASGRVVKELGEHKLGTVRSLAFFPGEGKVVSGGSDNLVSVWDIKSGSALKKLKGHKGDILSVAVSSDGSRVLSASRDLTARLWTTSTGAEEKKFVGHGNWVLKVAFAGGDHAISSSLDKTFRLWDLNSGSEVSASTIGPFGMWGVDMSKDGTRALTGSNNFSIRLWQLGE